MPGTAISAETAMIRISYSGSHPFSDSIKADAELKKTDLFPILRKTPKDSRVDVEIEVSEDSSEEMKKHLFNTSKSAVLHLCGVGSKVYLV